jgi:hypothetical protein
MRPSLTSSQPFPRAERLEVATLLNGSHQTFGTACRREVSPAEDIPAGSSSLRVRRALEAGRRR